MAKKTGCKSHGTKTLNRPEIPWIYKNIRVTRKGYYMDIEVLKISSKSKPGSVAGAIAGVIKERGTAEMQAIGAGALNQAVKAVAIARGIVAPSGIDLICIPAFKEIQIDGVERTAIRLIVEPRVARYP
jgi:stage V sporulation protein S